MRHLLAVDIGGTKTLCQLSTEQGGVITEQHYSSQNYASFDLILAEFLAPHSITIDSACFAIAGPVLGRNGSVTNLPWHLNADDLTTKFNIAHVHLCNDFEAVAYGISCLKDDEIVTLQCGSVIDDAPRAVIGAGTGLGQALLFPEGKQWRVIPTEGGHTDFAPSNSKQILLLEYLAERYGHVSYERVISGVGLVSIYEFLRAYQQVDENPKLRQAMVKGDSGEAISQYALEYQDPLALESLDMFIQIYGAQAGNVALSVLPRAGLYIAGGIAAKNLERIQRGGFMEAFVAKGKMAELVKEIPVRLILQPKIGLLGAQQLAQQLAV